MHKKPKKLLNCKLKKWQLITPSYASLIFSIICFVIGMTFALKFPNESKFNFDKGSTIITGSFWNIVKTNGSVANQLSIIGYIFIPLPIIQVGLCIFAHIWNKRNGVHGGLTFSSWWGLWYMGWVILDGYIGYYHNNLLQYLHDHSSILGFNGQITNFVSFYTYAPDGFVWVWPFWWGVVAIALDCIGIVSQPLTEILNISKFLKMYKNKGR